MDFFRDMGKVKLRNHAKFNSFLRVYMTVQSVRDVGLGCAFHMRDLTIFLYPVFGSRSLALDLTSPLNSVYYRYWSSFCVL